MEIAAGIAFASSFALFAVAIWLHCRAERIEYHCGRYESAIHKLDSRIVATEHAVYEHSKSLVECRECGTQTAREVDELKERLVATELLLHDHAQCLAECREWGLETDRRLNILKENMLLAAMALNGETVRDDVEPDDE